MPIITLVIHLWTRSFTVKLLWNQASKMICSSVSQNPRRQGDRNFHGHKSKLSQTLLERWNAWTCRIYSQDRASWNSGERTGIWILPKWNLINKIYIKICQATSAIVMCHSLVWGWVHHMNQTAGKLRCVSFTDKSEYLFFMHQVLEPHNLKECYTAEFSYWSH